MTKTLGAYIVVTVVTIVAHYGINLHNRVHQMEMLVKLNGERERIQNDQIQELISLVHNNNQKVESAKTEGYVAGVIDATNRPDHYQAVWHNGYDRGTEVQKDVSSIGSALPRK